MGGKASQAGGGAAASDADVVFETTGPTRRFGSFVAVNAMESRTSVEEARKFTGVAEFGAKEACSYSEG